MDGKYCDNIYDFKGLFVACAVVSGLEPELCSLFSAELGDFDPTLHIGNYVSEFRFMPDQVSKLI